jgi:hypothetical protein
MKKTFLVGMIALLGVSVFGMAGQTEGRLLLRFL